MVFRDMTSNFEFNFDTIDLMEWNFFSLFKIVF